MISLTIENYLKTIQLLINRTGENTISTGQLADAMDVSPGTVTSMLKTLSDSQLVHYKPYAGVSLTVSGQALALRMLRRHRLIELFLVETLKLTWDEVHEEAEHMEHAVSDSLVDRIDAYLGHPAVDPHGDPIPGNDGEMRAGFGAAVSLISCEPGYQVRLVRVLNQSPDFLRYLSEVGLEIGVLAKVLSRSPEAGLIALEAMERTISLGMTAAQDLLVELEPTTL